MLTPSTFARFVIALLPLAVLLALAVHPPAIDPSSHATLLLTPDELESLLAAVGGSAALPFG